jgi:hypothetical protein
VKKLQEERNVKWMLVVSVFMLGVSAFLGVTLYQPYYYLYPAREPTALDVIAFYLNRIDILLYIATITTVTLATTGFGKKDLMYKVSIYLFTSSMILLFASVLKLLFTYPWTR